jgi:hypothetical protein
VPAHAAPGAYEGEVEGEVIHGEEEVFQGEEVVPTPADPPVEHPKAAQSRPLRSVLLKRE